MKIRKKLLLALMIMGWAVQANAAIDQFDSGNGELFLTIRDGGSSYIRGLNVNIDDFLPSNASDISFASDANLQNFLSTGAGDYYWAVMAGDSVGGLVPGSLRYLTTTNDAANVGGNTNSSLQNYRIVDTDLLANVNGILGPGDDSLIAGYPSAAFAGVNIDTWGNNSTFNATAHGIGNSQDFWLLGNSDCVVCLLSSLKPMDVTQYAGKWTLASNGDLSYAAPVPLPPALWLLGTAMLGLLKVSWRKSGQPVSAYSLWN